MFKKIIVLLIVAHASQVKGQSMNRSHLAPTRVLQTTGRVSNTDLLLRSGNGQADLTNKNICTLTKEPGVETSVLLDFGKELHGGIQMITGLWSSNKPMKVRLTFGESVSEALSSIGEKGATNDHAMRDYIIDVPWLGKLETGNTGFRFVKIELLEGRSLLLKEVKAVSVMRDLSYVGSFNCSDELLNEIWKTGAYTVHLNMQEYLWDGIKRDRLVWVGDMHPEVATISSVFGYNDIVPKSLDLARDITPLPQWMNGISTYSMWWVIIHRDWYMHHGDIAYLKNQHVYLKGLLEQLISKTEGNREKMDGNRFLDWPSSTNPQAVDAGLHAMTVLSLSAGAELCEVLNDKLTAVKCRNVVSRLKTFVPSGNNSKQAAALMALSGIQDPKSANKGVIAVGGAKNFSTFYGYYMLQAKAAAGDYQGALEAIRNYWGAMLKLGATTFWEDFNLDWMQNAGRIDELPESGKKDIHGDYGDFCYVGYRHSLCHGWASGPTPWLTEHILGIKVTAPGAREITVKPNLGDLTFAEGTFPTKYGVVKVRHSRLANGKVNSEVSAPKQIRIIQ